METRLKVLFITRDFSKNIEKSSYYLSRELSKHTDLTLWHTRGHIQGILSQLSQEPDFILLNDFKPDYCPEIKGLRSSAVPYGIIMHDLHYKVSQRKRFIVKENIQHIFSICRDSFLSWYPEFEDRMVWFPFHVPEDIFRDYGENKIYNLLMMGAMDPRYYPLRVKMEEEMKGVKGFVHLKHPGYGVIDDGKVLTGEVYAREINRAKLFLTCDSSLKFPLLKYFEVLACKTLLLAPSNQEIQDLGFKDGENFVSINEYNFKEKAFYYLGNEQEAQEIAINGYNMVHKNHSTEKRVKQLITSVKEIINHR